MASRHAVYTPAGNRILSWLTEAGPGVSPRVHGLLLGELFATPQAVCMAALSAVVINGVALAIDGRWVFALFMGLETFGIVLRLWIIRRAARAAAQGLPTPTDLYLCVALGWSVLQGAAACAGMWSDNMTLRLLSAVTVMAVMGPLCARNYPAPRLTVVMVCLCILPMVGAAVLTGEPWLLVLVAETPLYLYGTLTITRRFFHVAIASLQAELDHDHRARHDTLTGLLNRLGLEQALAGLEGTGYVLFYLDLDGFKQVNDTHGHPTGDALLQAVARRLRGATREADVLARLGGDEFVIAVPQMPPEAAGALAESIIGRIAGEPYRFDGTVPLRIGLSVGFACAPTDGTSWEELSPKADAALYAAKRAGKGVQRPFTPGQASPLDMSLPAG